MTHICAVKLSTIGSDNGLSPGRRQAIVWINAGILLIGALGTNFPEILIGIQIFSFKKMHLKMSSAKWRPFCLGLNVLNRRFTPGGPAGETPAALFLQLYLVDGLLWVKSMGARPWGCGALMPRWSVGIVDTAVTAGVMWPVLHRTHLYHCKPESTILIDETKNVYAPVCQSYVP